MIYIKTENQRDYFRKYLSIAGIQENFNSREIEVAAEFLYYHDLYSKDPICGYDEKGTEIKLSMIEQLKDTRTLLAITSNLSMSFTVFRKHVSSLKEKGFFSKGDITKRYIPSNPKASSFKLQYESKGK